MDDNPYQAPLFVDQAESSPCPSPRMRSALSSVATPTTTSISGVGRSMAPPPVRALTGRLFS